MEGKNKTMTAAMLEATSGPEFSRDALLRDIRRIVREESMDSARWVVHYLMQNVGRNA